MGKHQPASSGFLGQMVGWFNQNSNSCINQEAGLATQKSQACAHRCLCQGQVWTLWLHRSIFGVISQGLCIDQLCFHFYAILTNTTFGVRRKQIKFWCNDFSESFVVEKSVFDSALGLCSLDCSSACQPQGGTGAAISICLLILSLIAGTGPPSLPRGCIFCCNSLPSFSQPPIYH